MTTQINKKKIIQSIVNVFETGKAEGDYSCVTVLKGDTGHLTYGRSQTTLGSGNLYKLLDSYMNSAESLSCKSLEPYMERVLKKDLSLDNDRNFHQLLKDMGKESTMKLVQDEFFDKNYWIPAMKSANNCGLTLPLSLAVVYDSKIHGSWKLIKKMIPFNPTGLGEYYEKKWVKLYIETRRGWLANHKNKLLNKTVYRMDAFLDLISLNNWNLQTPFTVHGTTIKTEPDDNKVLSTESDQRRKFFVSKRPIQLDSPLMCGVDVYTLQYALIIYYGFQRLANDGVFGIATKNSVMEFQRNNDLTPDGIVGKKTREALENVLRNKNELKKSVKNIMRKIEKNYKKFTSN